MRISGIESYTGGADNVSSFSLIQGEQRIFTGSWQTGGEPVDITGFAYDITANVEFYTVEKVAVSTSKLTISGDLTLLANPSIKALAVEKIPGEKGAFSLTFPEDFYVDDITKEQINIESNIEVDVPMSIAYIKYADRSDPSNEIIRMSRLVTILRRGE